MSVIETYLIKNWKTSAAGVALLALAALEYAGVSVPGVTASPSTLIAEALAALGLIAAQDAGK